MSKTFTLTELQAWKMLNNLVIGEPRHAMVMLSGIMYGEVAKKCEVMPGFPTPSQAAAEPPHNGYKVIADALRMFPSKTYTLTDITSYIEGRIATEAERNNNLAERFNLLEAIRESVGVKNWQEIIPTMVRLTADYDARESAYKQQVAELSRDAKSDHETIKYMRANYSQIKEAMGLGKGDGQALVTGDVIERIKRGDAAEAKLRNLKDLLKTNHPAYDGDSTIGKMWKVIDGD